MGLYPIHHNYYILVFYHCNNRGGGTVHKKSENIWIRDGYGISEMVKDFRVDKEMRSGT